MQMKLAGREKYRTEALKKVRGAPRGYTVLNERCVAFCAPLGILAQMTIGSKTHSVRASAPTRPLVWTSSNENKQRDPVGAKLAKPKAVASAKKVALSEPGHGQTPKRGLYEPWTTLEKLLEHRRHATLAS